jgi:acetyl-CoA acyltransferase 1
MGWTSEMVAQDYCVPRERMDELALLSHSRASEATKSGIFDEEILPVDTFHLTESGEKKPVTVKVDDGIRNDTTLEALQKLKPAFPQWGGGVSTGGNSSQVTDGAAACFLMRRSAAEQLGVPILARHLGTSVVGVTPRHMGIAPVEAISRILRRTGIHKDQVDLWEVCLFQSFSRRVSACNQINEAFSSMYVYCVEQLGLDIEKVNVRGGAIALG